MSMKIELNITIDGLEGWNVDWANVNEVAVVVADVGREARRAMAQRLGILLRDVDAKAEFKSDG